MQPPVELLVAVFQDKAGAQATVDAIVQMDKSGAVKLIDAAQIAKDTSGKVTVDELKELTAKKGAAGGAIIGGVLGLIFPPSLLAGAILGGAAGAITGRLLDTGAKTKDLKQIGDNIEPGEVAVVAVVEDRWVEQLTSALQGYDRIFHQVLDAKAAAALMADPATGQGAATAFTTGQLPSASAEPSPPDSGSPQAQPE